MEPWQPGRRVRSRKKKLRRETIWPVLFEVCSRVGVVHPDYLLQPAGPLSWNQALDWVALFDLEPWGDKRDDMRTFAAAMVGVSPYLGKGADLPEPCWPYWKNHGTDDAAGALQRMREFDSQWPK